MINNQLDISAARATFAEAGRCRIDDFLAPDLADRLLAELSEGMNFDVAYACSPSPKLVSASAWQSMTAPTRKALNEQLMARASEGQGFLYCTYLAKNRVSASSRDDELMDSVFSFWGGDVMQKLVADITSLNVKGAESQFTRFTVGQYLTRHRDTLEGNKRLLAFVLSLSRGWHPDWGGLLHFYNEDGEIEETWTPRFNTLQIFDIRQIHGVSVVAPCAPRGRYSLTGWFTA
jgi:SM-20-related protein